MSKYIRIVIISLILLGAYPLYKMTCLFFQIHQLKNSYIKITPSKNGVQYSITNKKPKEWISNPTINSKASHAIVISEDWNFYNHKGIDPAQIKESILEHFFFNKRWRGASTITQQLIKNLFLNSNRTISRKFKELIMALYLERILSKNQILELYLNIIEYGDGLYGIKAASQHYFQKKFQELTPKEGAFLAMLLPNPKKYSLSFRGKQLTPYAKKIIESILHKLSVTKYITHEEKIEAQKMPFSWEST